MDPDANIKEQLDLAERLVEGRGSADDAARLAELVLALNGWLTRGGFYPAPWRRCTCGHRGCRTCGD